MKKLNVKVLLAFGLIASLMMGSLQLIDASQNYKITYSPGAKGTFNQELIDDYKTTYGESSISVSDKTGSVTITVEKEAAMPKVPTVSDITLIDSSYYVRAGSWEPTQAVVTKSATYVVKYDMLNNGKEYTIRFIDSGTGEEVASPIISMANVGEQITYTAKIIEGYEFDQIRKTLVVSNNARDNVLEFMYTGGNDRNVTVNTVVEDTTATPPVVAPVITPVTPTPEVDTDTPETEDIEDPETPSSDLDEDTPETEDIEKEETPKSSGDSNLMNYVMYGIVGLIVIAGVVYIVVRKQTESES